MGAAVSLAISVVNAPWHSSVQTKGGSLPPHFPPVKAKSGAAILAYWWMNLR